MVKGEIYEVLKKDHENVKESLREILDTRNTSRYPEIKKQLEAHMIGEENFLYPPMEFVDEEMVKKNEKEHDIAWRILAELDNSRKTSDEWMNNLKQLNDLIVKHVEREEEKLFPKASETLSEEAEEDILKLIEEEKSSRM